jgi:aromatic ring-opening dioxygenase catalytic subunit (LigB family)
MAEIVGAMSLPHLPFLPMRIDKDPESLPGREYREMAARLDELAPDVIVAFSPDHLQSFFFDNLPVFAVAMVDQFTGAIDNFPVVEAGRVVLSHRTLGRAIYEHLLREDFDAARVDDFSADHSVIVPLQLLNASRDLPVVPLVINGLAPPLPNASRVHAFGRAVGHAIRAFEEPLRVLVLADGGINQEVAGPKSDPGHPDGAPDQPWLENVVRRVRAGEIDELVAEATRERIAEASNAAGELFTVLALLGAIGDPPATHFVPEPKEGIAFGLWNGGGR